MITIYLDMDGVLADFDSKCVELTGKHFMVWPDSQSAWAAIEQHQDMYRILPPLSDALALIEGCVSLSKIYGCKLAVLTAIPRIGRLPLVAQHKQEWLAEHFPQFPDLLTNFNIGPYAVDKQNHCKPDHVLIDDSDLNIPQWIAKGGCGILHTSAEQSLAELVLHLEKISGQQQQ